MITVTRSDGSPPRHTLEGDLGAILDKGAVMGGAEGLPFPPTTPVGGGEKEKIDATGGHFMKLGSNA